MGRQTSLSGCDTVHTPARNGSERAESYVTTQGLPTPCFRLVVVTLSSLSPHGWINIRTWRERERKKRRVLSQNKMKRGCEPTNNRRRTRPADRMNGPHDMQTLSIKREGYIAPSCLTKTRPPPLKLLYIQHAPTWFSGCCRRRPTSSSVIKYRLYICT